MSELETWRGYVDLVGKPEAYRQAHLDESLAVPFWTEAAPGWDRLNAFAWRAALDEFCERVSRGVNRQA